MRWRVYYGDGSTFSHEDGLPEEAPKLDVQIIASVDEGPNGPENAVVYLRDFYWWTDDGWYGGDIFGLWDYLAQPGSKVVLFGRSIPTGEYRALVGRAIAEGV